MDISQAEQRMKALAVDTADEEGGEAGSESNGTGDDEMEEDTDDMDSEELRQDLRAFGIRQLLPMEDDDSGIDAEALAYLRSARAEAARIPAVCVSTIDARIYDDARTTAYVDPTDDRPDAPNPDHAWTCQVVDDFIAARTEVHAAAAHAPHPGDLGFPSLTDRQGWTRLVGQTQFQPFSSTLACMNGGLVAALLACLAREAHALEGVTPHTGLWLYGLMVRLEKPVHSYVSATLRSINRLARERRPHVEDGVEVAEGDRAAIAMYDTLLVLAGGFFGQDPQLCGVVDQYVSRNYSGR